MLQRHHRADLLHGSYSPSRRLSTTVDLAHLASPIVDIDHLSTVKSKSDLLKSYRVTPPIHPWPARLFPKRLAAMIRRQPDLNLALRIFHHAGDFHPGFSHNYFTYHAIIEKLARARAFSPLESVLTHLKTRSPALRCGEDAFITVIRSYGLAGKPSSALRTFLSIRQMGVATSVRSLNTLLNAMIQNRRFDLVSVLFKNCQGKFGIIPNVCTCNILVKALCKMDDLDGASEVLDEMPGWGMVPNAVTYTTILGGYCARGDLDGARRLFEEILARGWLPDTTTYTVLIDGYCRQGRLMDAVKIMDEMDSNGVPPNDVTFSVVIESYCKEGKKSGEALSLLHDMLDSNYVPSSTLCCKVIDVLCQDGKVEDACDAWKKLLKKNCTPDNAISSTLIYWLCRKGKVWEARKLFGEFEKGVIPSVLTYNTLISGMCENGELQEAGRLWDDMVEKKIAPNAFTYNVLIKGFCKEGKAKEAVVFLEEMLEKGCAPDKFTYAVLVDGLYGSRVEAQVMKVLEASLARGGKFLLDEECWSVFVSKAVNNTGNCAVSLDLVLDS